MANYFASIFGTEKDKTILIQNLYVNLQNSARAQRNGKEIPDVENQKHFDEFYEDIYVELEEKYGPIEEMNVCDNLGDHLIGNVYVKFRTEEDAEKAVECLNNRWFAGKPVYAELSTVTDFREAACRQYEIGTCERAGQCNFMHIKQVSDKLKRHLFGNSESHRSSHRSSRRSHMSRSRSGTRSNSRSRSPSLTRMSRSKEHGKRSRSRSISFSPKSSSRRRDQHRSSRHRTSHRHYRHGSGSRSPSPRVRSRSPVSKLPARSRSRSLSRSPASQSKSSRRSHKSSRRHS